MCSAHAKHMLLLVLLLIGSATAAVDLRGFSRLSHDTLALGEKRHPRNHTARVKGYALLHLDHNSQLARAQRRLPSPVAKALHFSRKQFAQSAAEPCASPIADGAAWRTSRGYFINARNTQGLSAAFLERAMGRAFRRWSCVLERTNRLVVGPLLGVRTDRDGSAIRADAPDGVNEVGLTRIDGRSGTLALTILWGIFDGPESQRELTEFKMLFDEVHYSFGNASERGNVIDFEATATHEAGHVHGLDDIYGDDCSDVTMFATSAAGETNKRTLDDADIAAARELYT